MGDEFSELYNMLSADRDDVKRIKEQYEKDMAVLLGRIRSYHINDVDIRQEYDLENDFEKYKVDNIFLNYNLDSDAIDYKIALLQGYLQDLFIEKKFNEYRREQEEKLTRNEYLEYVHNSTVKGDKVSSWYQEFMQK